MIVSCPICSELMLLSDHWSATPCGHIFHETCISRWLQDKTSCPQCRQECSKTNTHRIFLPEVQWQDGEYLFERMEELNRIRLEAEKTAKKEKLEKQKSEREIRRITKQYHKALQRNKKQLLRTRNGGPSTSSHIPNRNTSNAGNVNTGEASTRSDVKNLRNKPKQKRNQSRVDRAKNYFKAKKVEHLRLAAMAANSEVVNNSRSDDSRSN